MSSSGAEALRTVAYTRSRMANRFSLGRFPEFPSRHMWCKRIT